MAFSIGRVGLDLTLPEPREWQSQGSRVTITGGWTLSPVTTALAMRDQLLGLADNPDEPIVPVVSGAEPLSTGWYRILSVDIPTTKEAMVNGHFDYTIQMEQVTSFGGPVIESVLTGGLLPNDHGIAVGTVQPWEAIGIQYGAGSPLEYSFDVSGTTGSSTMTRSGAGSDAVTWQYFKSVFKGNARFSVAPADYYRCAATIYNNVDPFNAIAGTVMVGMRQKPSEIQSGNLGWMLSNGLVRVYLRQVNGIQFEGHTGSGGVWSGNGTAGLGLNLQLWSVGLAALDPGFTPRILRNSPEEVVLRTRVGKAGGAPLDFTTGAVYLDLALRRGDRLVRCYLTSAITQDTWGANLKREATAGVLAADDFTGYVRATTADSDALKPVVLSSKTHVWDVANGRFKANTSTKVWDFGVGFEKTGAPANDVAADYLNQYLAAQSESQRIVAR